MIRFLQGRISSFRSACRGMHLMLGAGPNMLINFAMAMAVVVAGFYFQIGPVEWSLAILCCVGVIGMETMNTALERLADRVHPERHPEIAKAKDLAAAATLIAAIGAAIIGIIIFGRHLLG